jgi:hypothetical protein
MVPGAAITPPNDSLRALIERLPVRKPLTILVDVFSLIIVALSFAMDKDIPSNASNVLITVLGSVNVAYFASSSYESRYCGGVNNAPMAEIPNSQFPDGMPRVDNL